MGKRGDGSPCGHQSSSSASLFTSPTGLPTLPHPFNFLNRGSSKSPPHLPSLLPLPIRRMLPRTKSIFHVGKEGAGEATTNRRTAIRGGGGGGGGGLESFKLGGVHEQLQGLRILIQHPGHSRSNVVINSSLKSYILPSSPQLGMFLKACCLCKKELSPHKDVYMYRGDQGFCSEECRGRQILVDERRDRMEEMSSARERLMKEKPPLRRRAAVPSSDSSARHRRILAVA